MRFQAAATRLATIRFEDEFVEARLVLQALPATSAERGPLRTRIARYLLEPLLRLDAGRLRQEARDLNTTDVFDRIHECLRDAANLYEPEELWASPAPAVPEEDRKLLVASARLTLALFSPRGAEQPSALALAVLQALEPQNREWEDRLDKLLAWTDEAGSALEGASRRTVTAVDVLQAVLGDWPTPAVADRLTKLFIQRQQRLASILKKPIPGGEEARRALGELLMSQGDEMRRTVPGVAATYLRCGRIDRAVEATRPLAGRPGDDPELRTMMEAALEAKAEPEAVLRLARRFLPRAELLGGTATDNPDLIAAFRVLEVGLQRTPDHPDMLVLSAEIAKLLSAPFLALRQLEEAEQVLERDKLLAGDRLARVSSASSTSTSCACA